MVFISQNIFVVFLASINNYQMNQPYVCGLLCSIEPTIWRYCSLDCFISKNFQLLMSGSKKHSDHSLITRVFFFFRPNVNLVFIFDGKTLRLYVSHRSTVKRSLRCRHEHIPIFFSSLEFIHGGTRKCYQHHHLKFQR